MNMYRLRRLNKGWSQWELAMKTGICQSKLSRFENKLYEPKPEELALIRKALDFKEKPKKDT